MAIVLWVCLWVLSILTYPNSLDVRMLETSMAYAASKGQWRKELQSLIKIDMSIHVDLTPNPSINADLHAAEHLAAMVTASKGFQVPMLGLVTQTIGQVPTV